MSGRFTYRPLPLPNSDSSDDTILRNLTVSWDMDDVLCEFSNFFAESIRTLEHPASTHIADDQRPVEWFRSVGGITEYRRVRQHVLDVEKFYLNAEPTPGAVEGIKELRDAGVRVVVTTARGTLGSRSQREQDLRDSFVWLERYNIPVEGFASLRPKHRGDVHFHVDDQAYELEQLAFSGHRGVIFNQRWNANVDGLRLKSWDDLPQQFVSFVRNSTR